ncbi:histidine phosphatase family protein [Dyadobacter sandarakinus]|uniref:Histidine phosphatase family protein n=1 Tax=Dyadobacter sandarakinus TaxID=2747268 RepID=A0ABX7I2J0_9BACT|nr:histidine phosphatase family protein [Dyadobacter sandarakinus]QRR00289.1 histidine phosphatase family protein [Dyadobacter sandarakinus]
MSRFLLIRHASTDALGVRLSGRKPKVSLNAAGVSEAASLIPRLAGVHISAIYTSPLDRALQTAQPFAQAMGLEPVIDPQFTELDFGEWTDLTFEELHTHKGFHFFNSFRSATRIPGGETMQEAQLRIVNGLTRLRHAHPDQTVAIVSHSDLIKAALAYFTGIPIDLTYRLEISPASVSVVELGQDYVSVKLVNHTGELA